MDGAIMPLERSPEEVISNFNSINEISDSIRGAYLHHKLVKFS